MVFTLHRFSFLLATFMILGTCLMANIPTNYDPRLTEEVIMTPKKRPFCNVFTGCGRKRSVGSPALTNDDGFRQKEIIEESWIPMEQEIPLEELSRQILTEARLWEALQDSDLARPRTNLGRRN